VTEILTEQPIALGDKRIEQTATGFPGTPALKLFGKSVGGVWAVPFSLTRSSKQASLALLAD
jgi:hypothetical protein